jgi:hypothetical protein
VSYTGTGANASIMRVRLGRFIGESFQMGVRVHSGVSLPRHDLVYSYKNQRHNHSMCIVSLQTNSMLPVISSDSNKYITPVLNLQMTS